MIRKYSKRTWICLGLGLCTAIFFGVRHHTKQPQEVIKIYKAVDPLPRVTPRSPKNSPVPGTPTQNSTPDTDSRAETPTEVVSDDRSEDTTAPTADDFFTDEQLAPEAADTHTDDSHTEAEAAAEAAYAAQRVAELRIEIPQRLQERLALLERVEELAPSNGGPPELHDLRIQLFEEALELRSTIFELTSVYLAASDGDFSAFQPGGEFYELFQQNNMGIRKSSSRSLK